MAEQGRRGQHGGFPGLLSRWRGWNKGPEGDDPSDPWDRGRQSLKSQLRGDCSLHTAARPVGSRAHAAAGCATAASGSGDENEDRANNDVKDDDLLDRGRLSDGRPKVLWPHWVRDIAEI